ncbi:PKD domain-containing protein [Mongoliitalea daihaiensis]|uniref:PKD domain-containing protein n=1 Tax=Mongoliitalea daihaiensis TaxID=2782006 RepID=UPI001F2FFB84|nr:PKD domain-containing protein [Mongoliitalea daihaiensis]UJP64412.1 gliding motility-associated C-terminal domain-containing protein [Mongoliitalea daihaiensis]
MFKFSGIPIQSLFLLSLALLLVCFTTSAQVRVPFEPRSPKSDPSKKNYRINGDFLIIGNTNLTLEDYDDFKMNDNQMVYTSAFQGGSGNHINSSGAELRFPEVSGIDHQCTEVLFAGLYWTGRSGESRMVNITDQGATRTLDKQQITFQGPRLGQKVNLLTEENNIRFPEGLDPANDVGIFVGYQDVTDFVKFNKEGFYAGIDIALVQGTDYFFGGWSLIVVYENPILPLKDITVFDGFAYVRGDFPEEFVIPIDGIQTREEGDVRVKVGIMAGEGDVAASGDFFSIERGVGTNDFVPLSHPLNSSDNFFNSSISVGNTGRIPSFRNNTGMDLATFYIDNPNNELIANNQTSLRFQYGTVWDTFVIYNLTIAIDIDEPKIEGFHQLISVNGDTAVPNSFQPADELTFHVDIRNLGLEQLRSNRIELKLPRGVELISAEGTNFQQPVTTTVTQTLEPSGVRTLSWELGNLDPSADVFEVLARLSYTIRITDNCELISTLCGATVSLDGLLTGVRSSTGQSYGEVPLVIEKEESAVCLRTDGTAGSIDLRLDVFDFFQSNCLNLQDRSIEICNLSDMSEVSMELLLNYFPQGTRFFDQNPLESNAQEIGGSSGNPFPAVAGITFYASFNENEIGCFVPFNFTENTLSVSILIDQACVSTDGLRAFEPEIKGFKPTTLIYLNDVLVDLASIQRLAPGDYVLKVVDGNCLVEKEFTVRSFEGFDITLMQEKSIFENFCPGGRKGVIFLEVTGAAEFELLELRGFPTRGAPFVRSIRNPTAGEYEFGFLGAGRYQWRLTTIDNCILEGEAFIIDSDALFIPADFEFIGNPDSQFSGFLIGEAIQHQILQPPLFTEVFWDFGDGTTSTLDNPIHRYQDKGVYTVTLSLVDGNGCTQEVVKTIEISSGSLRMPEAFTPNGTGRNRYFFPVFIELETLVFRVYNRWGELMYFTTDPQAEGWDGRSQGKDSPAGTYLYKLDYKIIGEQPKSIQGSFLLLK